MTLALAREMLELAGIERRSRRWRFATARLWSRFRAMVVAQGGDPDAPLPRAPQSRSSRAERTGILERLDARAVGIAAWRLGAGRARKEDPVSAVAGVVCLAKPGDEVTKGQPLLELHTDEPERIDLGAPAPSQGAIAIGDEAPAPARSCWR